MLKLTLYMYGDRPVKLIVRAAVLWQNGEMYNEVKIIYKTRRQLAVFVADLIYDYGGDESLFRANVRHI